MGLMFFSHKNASGNSLSRLMERIPMTSMQQPSHLEKGNGLRRFRGLNIFLNLYWLVPAEMKLRQQQGHLCSLVHPCLRKSKWYGTGEQGQKNFT